MLRVVSASEATAAQSMAERIEGIMRELIAANPNTLLVVWEAGAEVQMRCEPAFPAVALGMLDLAQFQVKEFR